MGLVMLSEVAEYIDSEAGLAQLVKKLEKARILAVDTESDSFFSYREKVCLIQMSALGQDFIVDPLAVDCGILGEIFENPQITKIFHDAIYDLLGFRRDFGFRFVGLFDTMLASRLLGKKSFGLASLLQERFDVSPDKRFQRSDWSKRPLSDAQLAYAQTDTHYLETMLEQLSDELEEMGRLSWAYEEFARLPQWVDTIPLRPPELDVNGFWRIKGVKQMSAVVRGRVKELYLCRERIAQSLDRPPFKVFGDAVILDLAFEPPEGKMTPRRGVGKSVVDRFGRTIIEAIEGASPVRGPMPKSASKKKRSNRNLETQAKVVYEQLRDIRKREAESIGLEPEVLAGNAVLANIAKIHPQGRASLLSAEPMLAGWREGILVEHFVHALEFAT